MIIVEVGKEVRDVRSAEDLINSTVAIFGSWQVVIIDDVKSAFSYPVQKVLALFLPF